MHTDLFRVRCYLKWVITVLTHLCECKDQLMLIPHRSWCLSCPLGSLSPGVKIPMGWGWAKFTGISSRMAWVSWPPGIKIHRLQYLNPSKIFWNDHCNISVISDKQTLREKKIHSLLFISICDNWWGEYTVGCAYRLQSCRHGTCRERVKSP